MSTINGVGNTGFVPPTSTGETAGTTAPRSTVASLIEEASQALHLGGTSAPTTAATSSAPAESFQSQIKNKFGVDLGTASGPSMDAASLLKMLGAPEGQPSGKPVSPNDLLAQASNVLGTLPTPKSDYQMMQEQYAQTNPGKPFNYQIYLQQKNAQAHPDYSVNSYDIAKGIYEQMNPGKTFNYQVYLEQQNAGAKMFSAPPDAKAAAGQAYAAMVGPNFSYQVMLEQQSGSADLLAQAQTLIDTASKK
jgi:hypothetical protein